MCLKTSRVLLLGALLSTSAAAGNSERWKRTFEESGARGNHHHDDSHDFGLENDEDQLNRENYFQEIYMLQSAPKQIEFGHVCENPDSWEQRYERKDFDQNRHQGKVRWADKTGSHGEHYWDYNHSGPSGNSQEERQRTDEEKPEITSTTENLIKENKKRQLIPEEEGKQSRISEIAESRKETEKFLENFHREIGDVFHLESQNKNLFSNKMPPAPHFDSSFPFILNLKNRKPRRISTDENIFH